MAQAERSPSPPTALLSFLKPNRLFFLTLPPTPPCPGPFMLHACTFWRTTMGFRLLFPPSPIPKCTTCAWVQGLYQERVLKATGQRGFMHQANSHCHSPPRLSSGWPVSSGSAGLSCNTGEVPGPTFPPWPPWCLPASATSGASGKPFLSARLVHSRGQFHRSESPWSLACGHSFSTAVPGFPWQGSGVYQSDYWCYLSNRKEKMPQATVHLNILVSAMLKCYRRVKSTKRCKKDNFLFCLRQSCSVVHLSPRIIGVHHHVSW